jgi:hypothetical protein
LIASTNNILPMHKKLSTISLGLTIMCKHMSYEGARVIKRKLIFS